mgnify:CR=1 FL=1
MPEAISAIQGLDVANVLERSTGPTQSTDALAKRFSDLLAQEPASHTVPEVGAPNVMSDVIGQHEKLYHGLLSDLARASADSQHMTAQQATMKQVEMMFRVVNVTMQHNACSFIVQSSKNGLQTLMKNQ